MLKGHAVTLLERSGSGARLIEDDVAAEAGNEEAEADAKVLYRASFLELMPNYLQYDTIIWALISLLLVLAWGFGLLLLIYLPYKRYVLKRDILSRQLYVKKNKIIYKVHSLAALFSSVLVELLNLCWVHLIFCRRLDPLTYRS
jgi:hypothetical protein